MYKAAAGIAGEPRHGGGGGRTGPQQGGGGRVCMASLITHASPIWPRTMHEAAWRMLAALHFSLSPVGRSSDTWTAGCRPYGLHGGSAGRRIKRTARQNRRPPWILHPSTMPTSADQRRRRAYSIHHACAPFIVGLRIERPAQRNCRILHPSTSPPSDVARLIAGVFFFLYCNVLIWSWVRISDWDAVCFSKQYVHTIYDACSLLLFFFPLQHSSSFFSPATRRHLMSELWRYTEMVGRGP